MQLKVHMDTHLKCHVVGWEKFLPNWFGGKLCSFIFIYICMRFFLIVFYICMHDPLKSKCTYIILETHTSFLNDFFVLYIFLVFLIPRTGSADRTVKFWDLETFELIGSAGPEVFFCLMALLLVELNVEIFSFRFL